ncbi:hypothetical protein CK203_079809 [Vitis vinifera]|uniref:Uncharacterized protein n=1 Tax=Vitis vinifera TaxID=29760 RepID=A0A438DHW5_VITVI|nr:hypothetical protein CK203_079809 [Vitis vinifera]
MVLLPLTKPQVGLSIFRDPLVLLDMMFSLDTFHFRFKEGDRLICAVLTLCQQRAMEDALMALEFVKNIHDMMVSKMYKLKKGTPSSNDTMGHIMLEKNGKTLDFFPGEVSTDRITAIQEVYLSMASALSEADGIDYTDPEELELLVTTLIDLDAMDVKAVFHCWQSVQVLPDVNTSHMISPGKELMNLL